MHYCVTVAVPGYFEGSDLQGALRIQMEPHGDAEWDWYVVGGRWPHTWTLKPDAIRGPLDTEGSSFGLQPPPEDGRVHSDCARLVDIEPESLSVPYSWVDLSGGWHTRWLGPTGSGSKDPKDWEWDDATHAEAYLIWLETLPKDTWMVNVDCHN